MKLILGIDCEEKFRKAVALLRRLDFDRAEWHIVHVRPPIDPNPIKIQMTVEEASTLPNPIRDGSRLIQGVTGELGSSGLTVASHVLDGSAADQLLRLSSDQDADLIALGSEPHGRIGACLLGSVGRAIALSDRSFLIARGKLRSGPIKAVFATDFSAYARRALDVLIQMRPKGLSEVVVMTAAEMLELSGLSQYMDLLDDADTAGLTFDQILVKHGKEAVKRLENSDIRASSELRHGFVGHAIQEAMKEHDADLLIMGAQGHGFLERLVIGSIALEQVVSSPYNLLIIRSRIGKE